MPSAKSSAERITSPWLTITTLSFGCICCRSKSAPTTRSWTWRQLSRVLADLVGPEARPLAEIDLDHILAVTHGQPEPVGEDFRGFLRALQRAGIERLDLVSGETRSDRRDLGAASRRKPDSGQPPVDPAEYIRFAVAQKMKDRHAAAPGYCFGPLSEARTIASSRWWRVTAASKPGLAGLPSRMLSPSLAYSWATL